MNMCCDTDKWGQSGEFVPGSERRGCDWPGCECEGQYRAPYSRQELRRFRWFCLEHIRTYNASWNYYAGMSEEEVEADLRFDTVWQRPSWRIGSGLHQRWNGAGPVKDHFRFFSEDAPAPERRPPGPEVQAMRVLDLRPPVTVAVVKARYKQLVKIHHPDANGGDKASEERFKEICAAYHLVMDILCP